MDEIWETVKAHLKDRVSPSGFALWLEPLKAEKGPGGELLLQCPNQFALRWVHSHYLPFIQQILANLGTDLRIRLSAIPPAVREPGPSLPPPAQPLLFSAKVGGRQINRNFTFERFVVGSSNRLAFQASQALARNDTFYKGVLFLTSGPGLGKSHLSQAVGNYLNQANSHIRIFYITAEDFTNDMVWSLKNGGMSRFKERYRKGCDVLLLEDVHFVSGKEKIQAELCYTLDTLMDRHKRIVFTSCYLPGEIAHLSLELRSRLTGGLITPIGPPDFPTRVQILRRKAEERGARAPAMCGVWKALWTAWRPGLLCSMNPSV